MNVALASNDAIGTMTYYGLYTVYYNYCFNVAELGFRQSPDHEMVRQKCMDGVYTELRNVFENSYPGVNMYATKMGPAQDYEAEDEVVEEEEETEIIG